MGSKWDIEKFTGSNDFGLWKGKMQAVLIQQKCEKPLKGEGVLLVTMTQAEKNEMVDRVRSAIVLCLGDKLLRDVAKELTAASMWSYLESLYMTKSLAHRQFLKQQLYSFKMVESKTVTKQLMEFNKIIDDLENIEVNLEDEDKVILLLCALPRSFESFKDTMLYGKEDTITLKEVQAALRTKELTKYKDLRAHENNEGLSVSRGNGGGRGNQGSSKGGNKTKYKCFKCHKFDHFKRDCLENNDNCTQKAQRSRASKMHGPQNKIYSLISTPHSNKKKYVPFFFPSFFATHLSFFFSLNTSISLNIFNFVSCLEVLLILIFNETELHEFCYTLFNAY